MSNNTQSKNHINNNRPPELPNTSTNNKSRKNSLSSNELRSHEPQPRRESVSSHPSFSSPSASEIQINSDEEKEAERLKGIDNNAIRHPENFKFEEYNENLDVDWPDSLSLEQRKIMLMHHIRKFVAFNGVFPWTYKQTRVWNQSFAVKLCCVCLLMRDNEEKRNNTIQAAPMINLNNKQTELPHIPKLEGMAVPEFRVHLLEWMKNVNFTLDIGKGLLTNEPIKLLASAAMTELNKDSKNVLANQIMHFYAGKSIVEEGRPIPRAEQNVESLFKELEIYWGAKQDFPEIMNDLLNVRWGPASFEEFLMNWRKKVDEARTSLKLDYDFDLTEKMLKDFFRRAIGTDAQELLQQRGLADPGPSKRNEITVEVWIKVLSDANRLQGFKSRKIQKETSNVNAIQDGSTQIWSNHTAGIGTGANK